MSKEAHNIESSAAPFSFVLCVTIHDMTAMWQTKTMAGCVRLDGRCYTGTTTKSNRVDKALIFSYTK